ncbi:regenerating islet-derived protein 3-gamma-like isoform X1 [Cricetulus griseus]|uniref:Regenerating islet-derived 3 gamma n=1 Tax=Cricetulus griseus TaxID=10029 RepID=A0A8C2M5V3_CRIGR|nr:regenerating islet-derived protein 3-gamma-like isoform X1 [Cricetulus griseus]XP_035313070.1 regenerating islet-derived protein 3-gamma-like isoform X1 [Cricetulus griseus]
MLNSMALPRMSWMFLSCLMLLSQVQGQDVEEDVPSSRISCPKGSRAYGSYCYALFRIAKSWFDADLACQKRPSGHLVSVLNRSEASFVSSMIKSSVNNGQSVWIGLHDPTLGQEPNGGGWEWSNADVMNFFNWEISPSSSSGGYCGSLSRNSGYLKWRDNYCDMELAYVCKFTA